MSTAIADHPEEFRYLILALQRQGNRRLSGHFSQLGLTNSQSEGVEIIGEYGPMSTREVRNRLVCESGSPSRLLSTLAAKSITMTSQSTVDRRATLHALTPKGREILTKVNALKDAFHEDLSAALEHASTAHPRDVLAQLACLLTDPDLTASMKNRYPALRVLECVADRRARFGVAQHVGVLAGTR